MRIKLQLVLQVDNVFSDDNWDKQRIEDSFNLWNVRPKHVSLDYQTRREKTFNQTKPIMFFSISMKKQHGSRLMFQNLLLLLALRWMTTPKASSKQSLVSSKREGHVHTQVCLNALAGVKQKCWPISTTSLRIVYLDGSPSFCLWVVKRFC